MDVWSVPPRPLGPRPGPSTASFEPASLLPPPRPLPDGARAPTTPSPTSSPKAPISFPVQSPPPLSLDPPLPPPKQHFRPPAAGSTLLKARANSRAPTTTFPPPLATNVIADPERTLKGPGSSIFMHKGMWDLLGIIGGGRIARDDGAVTPPRPRNGPDTAMRTPPAEPGRPARPPLDRHGHNGQTPARASPLLSKPSQVQPAPALSANGWFPGFLPSSPVTTKPPIASAKGKENKRISIDMVGRPRELRHLAHASDLAQAEAILHRWKEDGVGKNADPGWVAPIKEAIKLRSAAAGVAEVKAAHDRSDVVLKVVNGVPSSVVSPRPTPMLEGCEDGMFPSLVDGASNEAVEDDAVGQDDARPATTSLSETIVIRDEEPPGRMPIPSFEEGDDVRAAGEVVSAPSLTTLEKTVAVKVFLENHYYGVLKWPRDRDARRVLLEKELSRSYLSDVERRAVRQAWASSESDHLRDLRSRVGANSFVKLKTIGHGAFGVVSLVRERSTGELFAMKQLRKGDMLKHGQEGYVRAERDVMTAASSVGRWIVRLAYSFQDVDHLYLVMEYMGGGDLLSLLIARDQFPEEMARFYMAEMVLAVEEAHKLGYIHRDIKPDNFLFDRNGHIKISDFGLATDFHWAHDGAYYDLQRRALLKKHGVDLEDGALTLRKRGKYRAYADLFEEDGPEGGTRMLTCREKHRRKLAYSVVGTNNYMAPEVLRGLGYDQACDWWSLGIILFEMLFGYPTFVSSSRHVTRQKILQWRTNLKFPSKPRISREAQSLIEGLICDREDRLGSRTGASTSRPNSRIMAQRTGFAFPSTTSKGPAGGDRTVAQDGAEQIKAHPWFARIDFENIHRRPAPFVPKLKSNEDTRYFDDDIDANPLPPPNGPLPETAVDPLLRHKQHGARLLELRKQLAFAGYTFKGPKRDVFDPRLGLLFEGDAVRGHLAMLERDEDAVDPETNARKPAALGQPRRPVDAPPFTEARIRSVSL